MNGCRHAANGLAGHGKTQSTHGEWECHRERAAAARAATAPRVRKPPRSNPRGDPHAPRRRNDEGGVPALANAMRRVAAAVDKGKVTATTLATFQAVALVARELRAKAKAEPNERKRTAELKRLDGLAESMARTAARNASLLRLLADDAALQPGTNDVVRELHAQGRHGRAGGAAGARAEPRGRARTPEAAGRAAVGRRPAAGQPVPRPRPLRRAAAARRRSGCSPTGR